MGVGRRPVQTSGPARCVLGKVATPKEHEKTKGLVIRSPSHKAGPTTKAGARVDVTLGPKAKPKRKRRA